MAEHTRRRITAADVARSLGISRATVSYVLNKTPGQTISESTRSRVLLEAERLGYRPHATAQALARGSSRIVLVVLPDWPVDFRLRRHLDETAQVLDHAGYSMVTWTRHSGGRARPLWEVLDPDVVVGLTPFDDAELAALRAAGITRILPEPQYAVPMSQVPALLAGTRLQVEHLHARGHRVLAFAASADPRLAELDAGRRDAATARADALGLAAPDVRPIALDDDSADRAVTAWREAGVTGVVAYNDDVAAAVAGAALRAGMRIPADLAVIGHDDSPLTRLFVPRLSSIRTDDTGVGRYFAELALQAATGGSAAPVSPDVRAEVVPREST